MSFYFLVRRACVLQVRRALPWFSNAGSWAKALVSEAITDTLTKSLKRRGSGACWRAALVSAQERGIDVFAQNLAATLLGEFVKIDVVNPLTLIALPDETLTRSLPLSMLLKILMYSARPPGPTCSACDRPWLCRGL